VVKPWLSVYSTFRNNPIIYIDPKGDDDFFDLNGKYIGSTPEGSAIRVITTGVDILIAARDVHTNTKLLTDFRYCPEDLGNRNMLKNIATFYGVKVGVHGKVGATEENKGMMHTSTIDEKNPLKNKVYISIKSETGQIDELLSNLYVFQNVLVHEKKHQEDAKTWKPLDHVDAIFASINHQTFAETSKEYKTSQAIYFVLLLNEAINKRSSDNDILKKVEIINKTSLGKLYFFEYNEQSKQVSMFPLGNILQEVEVIFDENNSNE
jgi:hypothetical protein